MEERPDPTLFFPDDLKQHSIRVRPTQTMTLCFFNDNHFSYMLKNVKILKSKQQFTAAICLNKGCPDYPRWEDSFQQRLIKIFNSSTLNNSLYCTVAVRARRTFVMTFAMSHLVAVFKPVGMSEPCVRLTNTTYCLCCTGDSNMTRNRFIVLFMGF